MASRPVRQRGHGCHRRLKPPADDAWTPPSADPFDRCLDDGGHRFWFRDVDRVTGSGLDHGGIGCECSTCVVEAHTGGVMVELPSGTVTFLFTDLEGSTRLWEEQPEAMTAALARHDAILRAAIASHHGRVVKTTGDGFHGVFARPDDALGAAVEAQRAISGEARRGRRATPRSYGCPHGRGRGTGW